MHVTYATTMQTFELCAGNNFNGPFLLQPKAHDFQKLNISDKLRFREVGGCLDGLDGFLFV